MVIMEDAETGEQLFVDTHEKKFRVHFKAAAERRQAALDSAFRQASVDVLPLSTEDDLVRAIVSFAARRKQRKQISSVKLAGQVSQNSTVGARVLDRKR